MPYVAGSDPLGTGRLGERAREVGLTGPDRTEEHDVLAALGESAGREACYRDPVKPAPLGDFAYLTYPKVPLTDQIVERRSTHKAIVPALNEQPLVPI